MKSITLLPTLALSLIAFGSVEPCRAALDSTAGNAGFQYLDVPPSPRQIALGWSGSAIGGSGFAYFNPAAPALDKTTFLSLGYAPLPSEYTIAHAQGSCLIGNYFVGANVTNHVVGGIYPTGYLEPNQDPDYNTPISYNGSMVSINAGYCGERLSYGLTVNGLQEQIGTSTAYGISASGGFVFVATGNITLGAAALQFGSTTGFTDDTKSLGDGYALPRSGRAGVAFTDTLHRIPFTLTGDVVYRDVGVKGTPLSQRLNRLTVPLGIEVWPTSYVAVRLGKRFNFDTELFTFGAGLRWSMLTFDMAFALARLVTDVEAQPFFSLSYSLNSRANDQTKAKPSPTSKITIDKPAEIKSSPAAVPVQQEPSKPKADTVTDNPPVDTTISHGAAVPLNVTTDSAVTVPEKSAAPVSSQPLGQMPKSPASDSTRAEQSGAPVKQ